MDVRLPLSCCTIVACVIPQPRLPLLLKAMDRNELNQRLPAVVEAMVKSVMAEPRMQHLNRVLLPDRDVIIECIRMLRQIFSPVISASRVSRRKMFRFAWASWSSKLSDMLYEQVRCCLRYREQLPGEDSRGQQCEECDEEAAGCVASFFDRIPAVRELLATDVQASFEGDPAAQSTDETIFCYPGLFAIFVQRMAHEFYQMQVPLLPRMMTEYAHGITGIDIHPGAKLGRGSLSTMAPAW